MQALQVIPWVHTMVQPSVHLTRTVTRILAIVPSNFKVHGGIEPAIQATSTDHTSVDLTLAIYADGLDWEPFKGYHYSLKYTAMKIRAVWGAVNNYKEL